MVYDVHNDALSKDDTAAAILLVGRWLSAVVVFDFHLPILEHW
jgi:hypothetical protein